MDVKEAIQKLTEQFDEDTRKYVRRGDILEYAGTPEKSPFLRALLKKAKELGITCREYTGDTWQNHVVVDKETSVCYELNGLQDLDNLVEDGMSSVAEAVFRLLNYLDLIQGKNITIVGRGHSVKGLADCLIAHNATVTVAHSYTKNLLTATRGRDVVIYATPKLNTIISYDTEDMVIDLGRCVPWPSTFWCPYVDSVGKLTISILLNRHVYGGLHNEVT